MADPSEIEDSAIESLRGVGPIADELIRYERERKLE